MGQPKHGDDGGTSEPFGSGNSSQPPRPEEPAVQVCTLGATEPCDEHPRFDNVGDCRAGRRECVANAASTNEWSECQGSIGPKPQDDCDDPIGDADCDGISQSSPPCICETGQTIGCGPETTAGRCSRGESTCVDNQLGPCVGAVFPEVRDCSSSEDNDCDGEPDNLRNGAPCQADALGICRSGELACEGSTLSCVPGRPDSEGRDACDGVDNDCDGQIDEREACRVLTALRFTLSTGSDGLADAGDTENGVLEATYLEPGSGVRTRADLDIDTAIAAGSTRSFTLALPNINNEALRSARIGIGFGGWTIDAIRIQASYTDGTEVLVDFSEPVHLESPYQAIGFNFDPDGVRIGPAPPNI